MISKGEVADKLNQLWVDIIGSTGDGDIDEEAITLANITEEAEQKIRNYKSKEGGD